MTKRDSTSSRKRADAVSGCRRQILLDYARWTALSALRSGAPIKSRRDVYGLLDEVAFDEVLAAGASESPAAFDAWHERETLALCKRDRRLQVGWAAKLVNVYLKTAAYVGDVADHCLRAVLHPPVDAGLWNGLSRRFAKRADILDDACCVRRIKDITDFHRLQDLPADHRGLPGGFAGAWLPSGRGGVTLGWLGDAGWRTEASSGQWRSRQSQVELRSVLTRCDCAIMSAISVAVKQD